MELYYRAILEENFFEEEVKIQQGTVESKAYACARLAQSKSRAKSG